ncbi:hypothetical protein WJR50_23060 [Catalinimonas sp. 4WD22]|uniref:hypothetical protein n=1 Tax=Catalinimonas locisalis TaxID=3133978 RepID=UPI00310140EA
MKLSYTGIYIVIVISFTIIVANCVGTEKEQEQKENEMMGEGMVGGNEMMNEEMRKAMMSGKMDESMMGDMRNIHQLLTNHEKIQRRVENLDNGVKTWTESNDPELVPVIQTHVRQMKERVENNRPIRQMDPLFRQIFEHADEIKMQIENTERGVYVLETSDNPQVVKLIQQHAQRAVSEFVEQGMSRAMEATPLPDGYEQ